MSHPLGVKLVDRIHFLTREADLVRKFVPGGSLAGLLAPTACKVTFVVEPKFLKGYVEHPPIQTVKMTKNSFQCTSSV
jgi:hypothetical protein